MQHQVKQKYQQSLLYKYNYSGFNRVINLQDVCSRNTTFDSHYRMGYDGQDKVFSIEHAFIIFCTLLLISLNSN